MQENNNSRPLMVSIKCITYNHEPYIRQCLEGFVMQKTNFRFEAVVHDDASTDGTADIIREYAEKYPDIIKPIYETENQYSKKDGSLGRIMDAACTGKYIAMCEGDDYWTDPLKLQKQVDFLETHLECSMCSGGIRKIYEGKVVDTVLFKKGNKIGFLYDINNYNNYAYSWTLTICYRRDILPENWAQKYKYSRDVVLIYELLKAGKGYYISELLADYRIHRGGVASMLSVTESSRIAFVIRKDMYKKDPSNYTRRHLRAALYSFYVCGGLSPRNAKIVLCTAWKLSRSINDRYMTIRIILVKMYHKYLIRDIK